MEELITSGALKIYGSYAIAMMILIFWLRSLMKQNEKLTDKLIEFADKQAHAFEAYNEFVTKSRGDEK